MSNFQELQAEKKNWNLASDEKLFEKLKHLENNVVASTTLVHNSLNELNKAFTTSNTSLQNTINAFSQLSFNKFMENVVEGQDEDGLFVESKKQRSQRTVSEQSTIIGSLKGEDEKLQEALAIALDEVL